MLHVYIAPGSLELHLINGDGLSEIFGASAAGVRIGDVVEVVGRRHDDVERSAERKDRVSEDPVCASCKARHPSQIGALVLAQFRVQRLTHEPGLSSSVRAEHASPSGAV